MSTVVVTGAAGFIGSALLWKLNQQGVTKILVVDDLGSSEKWRNLVGKRFTNYIDHLQFINDVSTDSLPTDISTIVHLGACSSTTETNTGYLMQNNYQYTRRLAEWSVSHDVRFIYASSAATYGDGAAGFSDELVRLNELRPLNMYGYSKHLFDLHAVETGMAARIVGLKFFNVYGPNEYHKAEMLSMVYRAYHQVCDNGTIRLFRSGNPDYADGGQKRDFVYVKDVVKLISWLISSTAVTGIYNVGSGTARTWNELATSVFAAMGRKARIEYIDMPQELAGKYQYYTQADIGRLQQAGGASCPLPATSLEDGIGDYLRNYLSTSYPWL